MKNYKRNTIPILFLWIMLGLSPCLYAQYEAVYQPASSTLNLYNNLVYNNNLKNNALTATGTNVDLTSNATNLVDTDPKFINQTNYLLQKSSSALDKGTSSSNALTSDLRGFPRVGGTAIDIGAYEYVAAVSNISAINESANNALNLFNNILYNDGTSNNALNVATTNVDLTSNTTNLVDTDPKFINQTNYLLKRSSSGVNKGINSYNPLASDMRGFPRVGSGTIDMGAYEYVAAVSNISAIYESAGNTLDLYNNILFNDGTSNNALNVATTNVDLTSNVTNLVDTDPKFVNQTNYLLQSNSSAINKATNPYNLSTSDLRGFPRVYGETVDMGALEFVAAASNISAIYESSSNTLNLYNNLLFNDGTSNNALNVATSNVDLTSNVTNLVDTDPKFVNQTNYLLQKSSPAINKGTGSYNTLLSDLRGFPRVGGTAIDMGALEFVAAVSNLSGIYQPDNSTLNLYNNILYNNITSNKALDAVTTNVDLTSNSSNLVDTNPLFTSRTNYALISSSPALNTGTNSYNVSNSDVTGDVRIMGGTIEKGAYEFKDVVIVTGITDRNNLSDIKVFTNSNKQIVISNEALSSAGYEQVAVYDIVGKQLIRENTVNDTLYRTRELNAGIYLVEVISSGQRHVYKVIVR